MSEVHRHEMPHGRHEEPTPAQPAPRRRRVAYAVIAAGLCLLLGIAISTQVRHTDSGDTLDTARPADLLVVLDNLHQRDAALRQEITSLQRTLTQLQSSDSGSDAALADARNRLAALSIQVGTVGASGPGVRTVLADPAKGVGAETLLDHIQELRAAGAETMEIDGAAPGQKVRIGVDTWVSGTPWSLTIDGTPLTEPYQVVAIGDPPTLAAALGIPGGVVDSVSRAGGSLRIDQLPQVTVDAVRTPKDRQYAQPEK